MSTNARRPLRLPRVLVATGALAVPSTAFAAATAAGEPSANRWIVIGVGAVVAVLGAWLGRVFVLPQPVGTELSWPGRARRAAGALAMAFGVWLVIAGASATFEVGDWHTDFEKGAAAAKASGGPVIVDAWAEWCGACKEIYAETLSHPDVVATLAGFTRIKVDMDRPENEPLYDRFGFENLPWVAIFDSADALLAETPVPRVVVHEKIAAQEFLGRLEGKIETEDLSIAGWLAEKGLAVTLLLIFLGGVAVSFTPCVVPVYILTINVIGTRRTSSLLGRLGLSSVYVLGLALTYSVLGVVAGLSTMSMGAAFRNPIVVGALAGLFILLALFYLEIFRLPQAGWLAAKITGSTRSNVATAFLLGTAGGLIAAPCVGPMLLAILAYIGTQHDAWLGFWLMFTFAIGMGLLFIAIGTSTALLDRVRKAGAWGYRLEMVFAVTFLAIGIYYLRQAVPALGALVPWLAGAT